MIENFRWFKRTYGTSCLSSALLTRANGDSVGIPHSRIMIDRLLLGERVLPPTHRVADHHPVLDQASALRRRKAMNWFPDCKPTRHLALRFARCVQVHSKPSGRIAARTVQRHDPQL